MNTQDLLGRIEPLLSRVNKPIQYVGAEHNSYVKDSVCYTHLTLPTTPNG